MTSGRSLRVLILARELGSDGGVVNFVQQLFSNLPSSVAASHYCIGRRKGRRGMLARGLNTIEDAVRLWREARLNDYDVIHLNPSLNAPSVVRDGLFMVVLKAIGSTKTVVSFHGWDSSFERRIGGSWWKRKLFGWAFGGASEILVLAPQFKDWLVDIIGFPASRTKVFTTSFDTALFSRVTRRRADNGFRLVFMARLVRDKGIYELLEAFQSIASIRPDISLILAGDGEEWRGLQKWVEERGLIHRISCPGYLRGHDKAELLMNADLFVFPTYYGEGCPVALLEAMAAGLPVVTTPVGGIPGIVSDGVNGVLLKDVRADTIADAIKSLMANPDLRQRMGEQNRTESWDKYTALVVAQQFEKFYLDAVGVK